MRYLLVVFFSFVFIHPAYADCISPPGAESATRYDFTAHKLYYCDGANWVELGGAAGGAEIPQGSLCGLAHGSSSCSSGTTSISTCLGIDIKNGSCPTGYTKADVQMNTGSVGSPSYKCIRTCRKN